MPNRLWIWIQNSLCIAIVFLGPMTAGTYDRFDWGPAWLTTGMGILLIVVGAWYGMAGVRDLGDSRTPHPEPKADGRLITLGIYARMRHPLYSSLMHIAAGWTLIWASRPALIATVALLLLLIAKARREESLLLEKFPEYGGYKKRVRRF